MNENITKRTVNIDLFAEQYFNPETKETNGTAKPLMTFKNISADFVIQKSRGAVVSQAQINIYNLSKENIGFFTTFRNETILGQQQRRIRLTAGYEGKEALLFNGDIIQAMPTMRPDIMLECDCYSNFSANFGIQNIEMHGPLKLKDICQSIADKLKLGFTWLTDEKLNKDIDNFYFSGGSLDKVLYDLNRLSDAVIYVEDGYLICDNSRVPAKSPVLEVNKDTGMIGLPRPSMYGCDVTVLLNPAIKLGQQIHLVSEAIPSASGNYFVYGITHRGSYRGNAFYTEIQCMVYDI